MAREFSRRVTVTSAGIPVGRTPREQVGTDLIPVDPATQPAPASDNGQPRLHLPTFVTRAQLVESHGEAIGSALYQVVEQDRAKAVAKFRGMQERLTAIRGEIAAEEAKSAESLQGLQRASDAAYQAYMTACHSYEVARARAQSALVPLINEAEQIVRELNAPMHQSQVKNWVPVVDTRRPLG